MVLRQRGDEFRRGQRGASAVEFALVLPVLVMLVFGIFEFGRVFAQDLALSNGAREGGRAAVAGENPDSGAGPLTCSEIYQRVRQAATTVGVTPGNVTVVVSVNGSTVCSSATAPASSVLPCSGTSGGATLEVSATYQTSLDIPLVLSNSVTLDREGVFRCEYQDA